MKSLLLINCAVLFLTHSVHSANILFFFGVSTYSHRLVAWPLAEALAERNHSVTFFQPYPNKNPNPKITDFVPKVKSVSNQINMLQGRLDMGHWKFMLFLTSMLPSIGLSHCEEFLGDPVTLNWILNNKFDLIIIDGLFNECAYGIAHLHKAKTVLFGTTHPFEWIPDGLGYPSDTSWIPTLHFSFDIPLSFINRVFAELATLYMHSIRHMMFPKLEKLLKESLKLPEMPSIPAMVANTSLMFTNTHFSEELSRTLPANVIPIGGINCKDQDKLNMNLIPKDMRDFINGGKKGFILVSFGSGARISDAPEYIQNIFFDTFGKMKEMRFVWKWELDRPERMPANVMTTKWIPQQELLAHPKIKAFVTHGGLLSMHEAICNPVPMIAFPVFAEQDFNGERLQRTERGITLDITSITAEKLEDALQRILKDDKYKRNVLQVSKRFMDRPAKPVDTAVWWVEYVLRQEDTSFMRPMGSVLSWYQRRSLDVWAFLFSIIILYVYVSAKLFQFGSKALMSRLRKKKVPANKKNK